jgi:hypothetical protein
MVHGSVEWQNFYTVASSTSGHPVLAFHTVTCLSTVSQPVACEKMVTDCTVVKLKTERGCTAN